MTDVVDLRRSAEDLEKKMKACSEVKSYKIEIVPDDMKIILTARLTDLSAGR